MSTAKQVEAYGKPLKERNFYKALVRLLRYREGDLISEQLREIQTPALLIWGAEDKVVPLSVGKRLAKDLPHAELITYHQTGHLVTEEGRVRFMNKYLPLRVMHNCEVLERTSF